MGDLLYGDFKLKITSLRNPGRDTDRYNATVVSSGQRVSVKFQNNGQKPETFIGRTAIFNGNDNDIQSDPEQNIDLRRANRNFNNPFV